MLIYFLKTTLIFYIIIAMVAFSFGLEGALFAYLEGAPTLGLIWGTNYTYYRIWAWPYMSKTNLIDLPMENVFKDISENPRYFLYDVLIWLVVAMFISTIPQIRYYVNIKKKKKIY